MLAGAFLLAFAGCAKPDDPTLTSTPVTEVTVDMTEVWLTEGESVTLIAMVSPENATYKAVTWSSSNPAVATVNESGRVTAVAAGTGCGEFDRAGSDEPGFAAGH